MDNNCVFYIGKGTGARHSQTTKRSKGWRDVVKEAGGFNVEILKDNLEDAEAYKLESDLITNPDESWRLVNKNNFKNIVELDFDIFNEWLYYDPSSPSCLRWKKDVRRGRNMCILIYPKGTPAGSISYENYWHIGLHKKLYRGHRIVYLLCKGSISSLLSIDHINHESLDNRIENLRMVSQAENSKNTSIRNRTKILARNKTGVTGISIKESKFSVTYIVRWRKDFKEYSKYFNTKTLNVTKEELFDIAKEFLKTVI